MPLKGEFAGTLCSSPAPLWIYQGLNSPSGNGADCEIALELNAQLFSKNRQDLHGKQLRLQW